MGVVSIPGPDGDGLVYAAFSIMDCPHSLPSHRKDLGGGKGKFTGYSSQVVGGLELISLDYHIPRHHHLWNNRNT